MINIQEDLRNNKLVEFGLKYNVFNANTTCLDTSESHDVQIYIILSGYIPVLWSLAAACR